MAARCAGSSSVAMADLDQFVGESGRSGSVRDILVGEREERQQRRGSAWWPRNWGARLFGGRRGIFVLAGFLVVGLGWTVSDAGVPRSGPALEPVGLEAAHPEVGRQLGPAEYSTAARFGEPLRLGPGGMPELLVESTGEVREVTPVEVEFDRSGPVVFDGVGPVLWQPGPRGWGIWWVDQRARVDFSSGVRLPRVQWRDRQERELDGVLDVLVGFVCLRGMTISPSKSP